MTESVTEPGGAREGTLWLVRHGQASLGERDYDRLSGLGHVQARHVRGRLQAEAVDGWRAVCGTHKRHHQTMALLAPDGAPVSQGWLNEYMVSALVAAATEQAGELDIIPPDPAAFASPRDHLRTFLEWFPDVIAAWQEARLHEPVNGPWSAWCARIHDGMTEWLEAVRSGETVVMVSSAGTISLMVAVLTGRDLSWQRDLNVRLYNTGVCRLSPEGGGWHAESVNCVRHLRDPALHTLA